MRKSLNTAEAVDYSVIPRYDAESRNARKSAVTGPRIMCGVTCRAEAVDIGTEVMKVLMLSLTTSQYRRSSRHRYPSVR